MPAKRIEGARGREECESLTSEEAGPELTLSCVIIRQDVRSVVKGKAMCSSGRLKHQLLKSHMPVETHISSLGVGQNTVAGRDNLI